MKDKILNDILNLEIGTQFSIREYLKKYEIEDEKTCVNLCFEVVKELGDNIEPKIKPKEDVVPIVGLPYNIIYVRK